MRTDLCHPCRGFRTFKCLNDFITICLWHNSTWYNANPSVPKMKDTRMFADSMSESVTEEDEPDEEVIGLMYKSICETAFPQVWLMCCTAPSLRLPSRRCGS